jgi:hypothetical protein
MINSNIHNLFTVLQTKRLPSFFVQTYNPFKRHITLDILQVKYAS